MKKCIALTLALLLAWSLAACQNAPVDPPASTPGDDPLDDEPWHGGHEDIPTIPTYTDYLQYIVANAHKLPENFVHYAGVSGFGDFNFAVFTSDITTTDVDLEYAYSFVNEAGDRICDLSIYHAPEHPEVSYPEISLPNELTDLTNLQTTLTTQGADVILGEIMYRYAQSGVLSSIQWSVGDITFVLTGDFEKNQSNAHLEKWLNVNTAQGALQEFHINLATFWETPTGTAGGFDSASILVHEVITKKEFPLTVQDTATVLSVFNEGTWEECNTKTAADYMFILENGVWISYSSEAKLFNDRVNHYHLALTDAQGEMINALLGAK